MTHVEKFDSSCMIQAAQNLIEPNKQWLFGEHADNNARVADKDMQLIVVFMHNIPSGHEHTMKPVGPNNTDPGCWQHFSQQCLAIVNMTFDELSIWWDAINQHAASRLSEVIQQTVKQNHVKYGSHVDNEPSGNGHWVQNGSSTTIQPSKR